MTDWVPVLRMPARSMMNFSGLWGLRILSMTPMVSSPYVLPVCSEMSSR